jgi:hypothetical protein
MTSARDRFLRADSGRVSPRPAARAAARGVSSAEQGEYRKKRQSIKYIKSHKDIYQE